MRILLVSLAYAPFSGVGAARMTSLSQYLKEKKHEVFVIAYDKSSYNECECKREIPQGVEVCYIEKNINKKELFKIIKKKSFDNNIDICVYSVGPYETLSLAVNIYKETNIPYVIDYRDIWLFDSFPENCGMKYKIKSVIFSILMFGTEKKAMKYAKRVVFVTRGCRNTIQKRYNLSDDKVAVIYNGFEEIKITDYCKKNEMFLLGVAGKFAYYNFTAARNVLSSCEDIGFMDVKLVHIGVPDKEFVELYTKDIYEYVGVKSYDETIKILSSVDAFVITYMHKVGLGTKVFDYMALNKPILYVGPKETELAEFVSECENGFICEKKEEIIAAIEKIVKEKITKLSSNDELTFSREHQNNIYEKLLMNVVRN